MSFIIHYVDRLEPLALPALRREELCKLTGGDFEHVRRGTEHLRVSGKREKIRSVSPFTVSPRI